MADPAPPNVPARTWPEMTAPTAAQLWLWLDSFTDDHDRDAGLQVLGDMLTAAHRGSQCFVMNHDAYPMQVETMHARIVDLLREVEHLEHLRFVEAAPEGRYRLAWLSARRRARTVAAAVERDGYHRWYAAGWDACVKRMQQEADRLIAQRGGI